MAEPAIEDAVDIVDRKWRLEIRTYVGTSVFYAKHYYGRLERNVYRETGEPGVRTSFREVATPAYVMDEEEARKLSDPDYKQVPGETSERFFDEASVIEAAKLAFKQVARPGDFLVDEDGEVLAGDASDYEPPTYSKLIYNAHAPRDVQHYIDVNLHEGEV